MHFSHIVTPGDKDIGLFDIFIAPHGLIQTKGCHTPGNGTGHTETCIGFNIVGPDTALEQFGGHIPVCYGPLSGAIHGHGILSIVLDSFQHFCRYQIKSFRHWNFDHFPIFTNKGFLNPILAVENLDGVIALDTTQPLIDRTVGIPFYRHGSITGNTHKKTAASTTKPARCFLPRNTSRSLIYCFPCAKDYAREQRCRGCCSTVHSHEFDKRSSVKFHLLLLFSKPIAYKGNWR